MNPSNPRRMRGAVVEGLAGISGQPRRIVVGLHQPHFSSGKVCQQFGVLSAHVACPDYFGTVDVGIIENPFVQNYVVARLITDQNEMLSWSVFQLFQSASAVKVLLVLRTPCAYPTGFRLDVQCRRSGAEQKKEPADQRHRTNQKLSRRLTLRLP